MMNICKNCTKEFQPRKGREKSSLWCCKKCFHANYRPSIESKQKMRKAHLGIPLERRLPFIVRNGYKFVLKPEHLNAHKQGYIAEHRLVMSDHLKRPLKDREVVHHINEITDDNRIENLRLCKNSGEHIKLYHPEVYLKTAKTALGRRPVNYNRIKKQCPKCEIEFETTGGVAEKTFCSRPCMYQSRKGIQPKNMRGLSLGWGWNKGLKKKV